MIRAGSGDATSSNSKSSTRLACLENTLKLTPSADTVAPSGKLCPVLVAATCVKRPSVRRTSRTPDETTLEPVRIFRSSETEVCDSMRSRKRSFAKHHRGYLQFVAGSAVGCPGPTLTSIKPPGNYPG